MHAAGTATTPSAQSWPLHVCAVQLHDAAAAFGGPGFAGLVLLVLAGCGDLRFRLTGRMALF